MEEREESNELHANEEFDKEETVACQYQIDHEGDACNAVYGAIDKKHVPSYTLDRLYRPRNKSAREKARYFDKSKAKLLRRTGVHLEIRPSEQCAVSEKFVSMEHSDDAETGAEDPVGEAERQWRQRTKTFNIHTREHPHDVETWWRFVCFQDQTPNLSGPSSVIEKKLSILEVALQHNDDNEELWLAYLHLCASQLSSTDLAERWQKALQNCPHSPTLWQQFIESELSSFGSFSVPAARTLFANCFSRLRDLTHNSESASLYAPALLSVMSRYCRFEWESGHPERGIGYCQALIELNILCGNTMRSLPPPQRIQLLEAFWESETPRVGEQNARSFAVWFENMRSGDGGCSPTAMAGVSSASTQAEPRAEAPCNLQHWIEQEHEFQQQRWQPLRTAVTSEEEEEEEEDSLLRVVMFDDIAPFLFELDSSLAHLHLLDELLLLLNVPAALLCRSRILDSTERLANLNHLNELVVESHPFTLFSKSSEPDVSPVLRPLLACKNGWSADRYAFARAALELVEASCATETKLCVQVQRAALEVHAGAFKRAKKLLKTSLKHERDNLSLWHAYAQLELSHGSIALSRGVYETALQQAGSRNGNGLNLQLALAQLELEAAATTDEGVGPSDEALLRVLCATPPSQTPSSVAVARARRAFASSLQDYTEPHWTRSPLSLFATSHAAATVLLALLLEYVAVGMPECISLWQNSLLPLMRNRSQSGVELEYVRSFFVRLMYRHSQLSPFAPRLLRLELHSCLQDFPVNPLCWRLLMQLEQHVQIQNRMRRFFDQMLQRCENKLAHVPPTLWMFSILWELDRPGACGRIHRLCEQALSQAGSSVVLWQMYLAYELHRVESGTSAKKLFYRSIHRVPSAKRLWLDGVRQLIARDQLSSNETSEIISLIIDKRIRIYQQPRMEAIAALRTL